VQAFDSAEERFAQDDISFLMTVESFWLRYGFSGTGLICSEASSQKKQL